MQMLDAVISLKDNFSDTLKTVESNVGNFQRTWKKTGRDIQRTGKSLESAGSSLTTVFTAPIIAATTASIKAYADLEQSTGGIETLFKGNADTVKKYANDAYKTAGISANSYMENVTSFSASLLNSMGGDTEKAAKVAHVAMVDMGDNANKMGTDIRDIQNAYQGFAKENYTMLDNLKLGYSGTKGGMEELLADAQKLTGVKYDISNLDDVFMAIHAIQEELDITGTTAQEAEETISGSFGMMKASVENLLGGLASADADVGQLIDNVVDSFGYLSKNVIEAVKRIWDNLPLTQFQKTLGAIVVGAGPALFVIGKLTTGIGTMVTEFGFLAGRIGKDGFLKAIFTPGVKVALVLAAIAGAAILVYKNWDKIKPVVDKVIDGFKEFWNTSEPIREWIKGKLVEAFNLLKGAFEKTVEVVGNVRDGFKEFWDDIKPLRDWVQDSLVGAFENLKEKLRELKENLEPLKAGFDDLKTSLEPLGALFVELWEEIQLLIPYLQPVLKFFVGIFALGIVTQIYIIIEAFIAIVGTVIEVVGGIITTLEGVITFLTGVFTGDWELVWEGIKLIFAGVIEIIEGIWNGAIELLTSPIDAVINLLDNNFGERIGNIKQAWEDIKEAFKSPITGTINLFTGGQAPVGTRTRNSRGGGRGGGSYVANNFAGTDFWRGGLTYLHERGGEIYDLPRGTRVYPHDKSVEMARQEGAKSAQGSRSITIAKLADAIHIREEADIDKLTDRLVRKLEETAINMA